MSELFKEALKLGAELLGDWFYASSQQKHDVAQLTHHQLALVFLNNIHKPSLMTAFTPLSVEQVLEAAGRFLADRTTVPVRLPTTADGWSVVGAARKPLTIREQMRFFINADLQPHVYLLMAGAGAGGSHVYAGCRYTDHHKANLWNWFGKAGAERSYQLLVSTLVQAPITIVTPKNADRLP
jgi:hypothetical protein